MSRVVRVPARPISRHPARATPAASVPVPTPAWTPRSSHCAATRRRQSHASPRRPAVAAMRAIDVDALLRSEMSGESTLASEQGRSLLALLGLGGVISAGQGPAQLETSATGSWGAPLRLKAKLSGAELDAEAQGTVEPWAPEPKTVASLSVRRVNLAPWLDRNPSDPLGQNTSLSSRVTL